jgi:cytochrome b involved in lipid metabolism
LSKLICAGLLLTASGICAAEHYVVTDFSYQRLSLEKSTTHNLHRVFPNHYKIYSFGYGYRTNKHWGVELGVQQSMQQIKTSEFIANEKLLASTLTSAQTISVNPKVRGAYVCAVGFYNLPGEFEFIGNLGVMLTRIDADSSSAVFNAKSKNSLVCKINFGLVYNMSTFLSLRTMLRYESTQTLNFGYNVNGSTHYFKPFNDTLGISFGAMLRF